MSRSEFFVTAACEKDRSADWPAHTGRRVDQCDTRTSHASSNGYLIQSNCSRARQFISTPSA